MYVEVGAWSDRPYPSGAVVVGYNGRDHSRAALAWGAGEAVRREATLLVLYAANYPGMTMEPGPGLLQRERGALEAAEEVTARGVAEALEAHPHLWVVGATEVTSPSRALAEASSGAVLVVLGSRGYGRVAGALLGSVAFAVASRASCPVVVVRDDAADRPVGATHPVVVGSDGSPAAAAAVDFAAERAAVAAAPLRAVTCTGVAETEGIEATELHASATRIAAAAAARARARHPGLTVTPHVEHSPAEVALVDASAGSGLVVVGTRGRGAFEGMLLGSVSHALIYGAACPVAVVGEPLPDRGAATAHAD
jgi:nucleotide-binding universal stress UspA family protein